MQPNKKGDVMYKQTGFTLIELMITVAVIGILAGIGFPAYNDYITRGKLVDATSGLSNGRVKMEQYFQDNRTYVDGPCPANTKYFTFACDPTATTYTITATGVGNLSAFIYTINQANTKGTGGLKAGWGAVPASCWIVRKGDSC